MGLDADYEPGPRSKNVGTSDHDRPKLERYRKGKSSSGYYQLDILNGEFNKLRLVNSPSPHRKSMPSRPVVDNVEKNEVKRGSVYQSSTEMQTMRKLREGNRKAESSHSDEAFLSFEVVDSLYQSCRNDAILLEKQNRSPLVSLNTELKTPDLNSVHPTPAKSKDFLDLSFRHLPEDYPNLGSSCSGLTSARGSFADSLLEIPLHLQCKYNKAAPELLRMESMEEPKAECGRMLCPENDGDVHYVGDPRYSLPKSFSAKARPFNSTCQPEIGNLKSSPKTRFSPLKKMFDPILKSKSLRSPLMLEGGNLEHTKTDPSSIRRDREFHKCLINEFSNATLKKEDGEQLIGKEKLSVVGSSPAHLHGTLRLDLKHDVPSFEFVVKDPEDVISAKTWKTDNAFNWVYTFHSYKKKINSGWGVKDKQRQFPPMIGQMNVSCYLCSEVSDHGSLENSMVTEFNLYDIDHARRSFSMEDKSTCSSGCMQAPDVSTNEALIASTHSEVTSSVEPEKFKPGKHASSDCESEPSACYPWAPADLLPHFEIAAIAVQIPFSKKGCLRDIQIGEAAPKEYTSLSSASNWGTKTSNSLNGAHVKVVIPSGTHGLPSTEDGGPSSLLDKWRSGGGCDCGGWDMGCPIIVFDNCSEEDLVNHTSIGSRQLMVLFVQGKKEKIPALSIIQDEGGQYSVEFHAQLSAIQAFSICIAILHSSEASLVIDQEKNRQRLHSNSLKLLLEEEVKHLIEAVAREEKRKPKKNVEKVPPSFLLDPPFSPMGRV